MVLGNGLELVGQGNHTEALEAAGLGNETGLELAESDDRSELEEAGLGNEVGLEGAELGGAGLGNEVAPDGAEFGVSLWVGKGFELAISCEVAELEREEL